MTKQTFFQRRWKLILNILTLLALAGLVLAVKEEIVGTLANIRHAQGWILLSMVPIQLVNYHAQTKLYQSLFSVVGNNLTYRFLYRTSLELNFVNHVFPSGGVTGISYFALRMRKGEELTGSKASLVQVMKLMLLFISFELILVFGLICLAVVGKISNMTMLVAASVSTLLFVGTLLFAYVVGSKHRITAFFSLLTRMLNRFVRTFIPSRPEVIKIDATKKVFDDFHDNYRVIRNNLSKLKKPFWYALLANITEILSIYVVYLAFGETVNIGAIILAYSVANFAGLVSVLPGGVGIYEALMTAVLATVGVPIGVSIPIIITYRLINTLIQVPPGYYYYHKAIKEGGMKKMQNAAR